MLSNGISATCCLSEGISATCCFSEGLLLFEYAKALIEAKTAAITDEKFPSNVLNVEFLLLQCLSERIVGVLLHSFLVSGFRSGNQYRNACRAIITFRR